MSVAPSPEEIYERAEKEGERRLSMSLLETVSTAFIAGVTIVFGIVGLGVAAALVEPALGRELGSLAGALAFGIGIVFLVVGRTELFSENLFDPVAAAVRRPGRKVWGRLVWLWVLVLVLNLVGGAVLLAVMLVEGALPAGSGAVLDRVAEEVAAKSPLATLARAVLAGALVALLSYLLNAVDSVAARVLVAYMVGVFLALGPFDHVVVSALHLLFGIWSSGVVGYGDLWANLGLSTLGNVVGGLLLITFTHTAQVKGA
ncbi:formate/nitrite transporter family protein [Cellulomonas carbonis]|uniref:Transport n=1 Tax=Cellulomonas carbonis T26 TaxID=947969 RepID=A0A0A0BM60_9CELL|nr:formate/nitrite transporter family protein [Cellulomonas carbonis]KGM09603.1 transport [Cellulomonas carbonis T26]